MQLEFAGEFALGIIDKDRKDIDYLREFYEVHPTGSLILHKHREKHHYIIQIKPAIERFILANAASVGISLEQYGLPSEFEQLKKVAKQKNSKADPSFRSLFKAIHRGGAADFQTLARWVSYLKEKNYHADLKELKAL